MVTRTTSPDVTDATAKADHPLLGLANEASGGPTDQADTIAEEARAAADREAADAAMNAMMVGVQALVLGGLRAVRGKIAKTLPEINDEWTDEVLAAPARASLPVINKYAAKFLPMLADYQEEVALAMALLPLTMGYMNAIDRHRVAAAPAAAAPTTAPPPA